MTIDEAIIEIAIQGIFLDEKTQGERIEALKMAIRSLKAWKKTEAELKTYAEKLASESEYDSRVEAVLHCLNVMRKNLDSLIQEKEK